MYFSRALLQAAQLFPPGPDTHCSAFCHYGLVLFAFKYDTMQMESLTVPFPVVWFLSLRIIILRFIQGFAYLQRVRSFLLLNSVSLSRCMKMCSSILLLVDI